MDTGIIIALVGLAGAILGACIQAFGPSLLNVIRKTKNNDYVSGYWEAEWSINYPKEKRDTFKDSVHLQKKPNGSISGTGNVQKVGEYLINGTESNLCVLLTFKGKENKEELAGVVLVKKLPGVLSGHWAQLDHDGELIGGVVDFNKKI